MSSARSLAQLQYDMQVELMNKSYEQNMQATENERAYNTPSAQLARLQAAGLNPLYYGLDGNSSNGAPFSTSTPQAPDAASAEQASFAKMQAIQGGIAQMMQASKNLAEVQQMVAQTNLINKQAEKTQVDTQLGQQDLQLKPQKLGLEIKVGESTIKVNESQEKVNNEKVNVLVQEVVNAKQSFKNLQQDIAESQSRQAVNEAQIPVLKSQEMLNKVTAGTQSAIAENQRAQAGLARQQEKFSYEQTFEKHLQNGYLPKELMLKLGIQGMDFKKQRQELDNLRTYGKLLDTQNENIKFRMVIDGAEVNLWRNKDGSFDYDSKDFVDYWKDMNTAKKLQRYADIYKSIIGANSNVLNSLIGLGGLFLGASKMGLFKGVPEVSIPSSSPIYPGVPL